MNTQTLRDDGMRDALLGMAAERGLMQQATGRGSIDRYSAGGLYAKVVDLPCDKAVSRGIEIEGDDGTIASELDRLQVKARFAQALRLARAKGGAALLILADDGPDLSAPMNPGRLRRVRGLRLLTAAQVVPVDGLTDTEVGSPTYGQALAYTVDSSYLVHASRLLTFGGQHTGDYGKTQLAPWRGESEVLAAWDAIDDYQTGVRRALQILDRKQQAVYGMKGMADLFAAAMGDDQLTTEAELSVKRRLQLVDQSRGVLNTVATDADDSFVVNDLQLGGLKDLLGELQVDVSAKGCVPSTLLFGRSPAGQNSTGEADFRGYYDFVDGVSQTKAAPQLERLVSLLYAQAELGGKAPESWSVRFGPLFVPTEDEAAKTRKTLAETDKILAETVDLLVGRDQIDAEAARQWLADRGVIKGADETKGGAADYASSTQTS